MKRIFVHLFLVLAPAVWSQAEARNALLIANGNYTNFASLPNPLKEAEELSVVLEDLGFTVTLVKDGSKEAMQEALLGFEDRVAASGGLAFFHYGGHAVQVQGKNYLIPATASIPDENRVRVYGFDVDEVTASLQNSGADTSIIILDSCRDNPLPNSGRRSTTRGLSVVGGTPKNSIVVFSAQAGSTARDGVFTPTLIKHLKTPESLGDIIRKVRQEVNDITEGEQVPGAYDQLFTPVYLAGRPLPAASEDQGAEVSRLQASLASTRTERRRREEAGAGWKTAGTWAWSVGALGAATAGVAWYRGVQLRSEYDAATLGADFGTYRNDMILMNNLINLGLGVFTAGISGGLTALFLTPSTELQDREIADLDRRIRNLSSQGESK